MADQTELRRFYAPALGVDDAKDAMFTFDFTIKRTAEELKVSFILTLNPKLVESPTEQPKSSSEPMIFNFDNNTCTFLYFAVENANYSIQGTINIVSLSSPNGQFDNQSKNFFFDDITFGRKNEPPQRLEGLFKLEVISQ